MSVIRRLSWVGMERKKSARVKKDMQLMQLLLSENHDEARLLAEARRVARHRVVVKRPLRGVYLADVKPDYTLQGKHTRYDVYRPG